jgi:hypothetical protein
MEARFQLGQMVATPGALHALAEAGQLVFVCQSLNAKLNRINNRSEYGDNQATK